MKKLLIVSILFGLSIALYGCWTKENVENETYFTPAPIVETLEVEKAVEPVIEKPKTGSFYVELETQPKKLPWNYEDNGTFLRAWADKNIQTISIPEDAKNVKIIFELAKISQYDFIPGNVIASVDWKHLCNGRLSNEKATVNYEENKYIYSLNAVSTQDKPNWDWSSAIGKDLVLRVWIGEHNNYVKSIKLTRDL